MHCPLKCTQLLTWAQVSSLIYLIYITFLCLQNTICNLPKTLDSKAVLCTAFPLLGCSRHKLHSSSLRTEFVSSAWTSSPNLGTVDPVPPSHLHLDVCWAFQTLGAQTELLMLSPSPLSPAGSCSVSDTDLRTMPRACLRTPLLLPLWSKPPTSP